MNTNLSRVFVRAAGVALAVTGSAKVLSAFGNARILTLQDPLIGIPFARLLLLVGALELIVAILCMTQSDLLISLFCVAWLSTNFLAYRLALWCIGWHEPCRCLGSLADNLGISSRTADSWMKVVLAFLLLGSYSTLVLMWQQGPRRINRRVPVSGANERSSRRAMLMAFFCAISVSGPGHCAEGAPKTNIEQVLSFLHSRTPIRDIWFTCATAEATPAVEGYFQARWQTNGYLLKHLSSTNMTTTNAIASNLEIRGGVGRVQWYIVPDKAQMFLTEMSPTSAKGSSRAHESYLRGLRYLSPIVTLGILNVDPSSVEWDGMSFQAIDLNGRRLHGELVPSSGPGLQMDYIVEDPPKTHRWSVVYSFQDAQRPLPSKLTIFYVRKPGDRQLYREYIIQRYILSDKPLPSDVFLPDPLLETNLTVFQEIDGTFFRKTSAGRLVLADFERAEPSGSLGLRVVFLAVSISGFLAIAFNALRRRRMLRGNGSNTNIK